MNAAANLVDIAKDETGALTEQINPAEVAELDRTYGDDQGKPPAPTRPRCGAHLQPEAAGEAAPDGRHRPVPDGHHVGLPRRDRGADRAPGDLVNEEMRPEIRTSRGGPPRRTTCRIDAIFAAREKMMEFNATAAGAGVDDGQSQDPLDPTPRVGACAASPRSPCSPCSRCSWSGATLTEADQPARALAVAEPDGVQRPRRRAVGRPGAAGALLRAGRGLDGACTDRRVRARRGAARLRTPTADDRASVLKVPAGRSSGSARSWSTRAGRAPRASTTRERAVLLRPRAPQAFDIVGFDPAGSAAAPR